MRDFMTFFCKYLGALSLSEVEVDAKAAGDTHINDIEIFWFTNLAIAEF